MCLRWTLGDLWTTIKCIEIKNNDSQHILVIRCTQQLLCSFLLLLVWPKTSFVYRVIIPHKPSIIASCVYAYVLISIICWWCVPYSLLLGLLAHVMNVCIHTGYYATAYCVSVVWSDLKQWRSHGQQRRPVFTNAPPLSISYRLTSKRQSNINMLRTQCSRDHAQRWWTFVEDIHFMLHPEAPTYCTIDGGVLFDVWRCSSQTKNDFSV